MEYGRLGHSDIKVPAVCLGTMTFGRQNSAAEAGAQTWNEASGGRWFGAMFGATVTKTCRKTMSFRSKKFEGPKFREYDEDGSTDTA
jgi:hypothetical protein